MSSTKSAARSELAHAIVKIFLTARFAWKVTAHRGCSQRRCKHPTRQPQRYDFSAVLELRQQVRRVTTSKCLVRKISAAICRVHTQECPLTTLRRRSCPGS